VGQVGAGLGVGHLGVGDEDDDVAGADQVGGGTVDANLARAALAGDDVGGQAVAVGAVADVDALAGQEVGGLEQVDVHGDGADVVEVGLGHGGAVNLGRHHRPGAGTHRRTA